MGLRDRAGLRRAGMITLGILGALLALIAVVVGGTLTILRTDWAGERVRRQVVSRANAEIQGTLAIDRLSFRGGKLQVWGVALRDSEGGLVVNVVRAEVQLRPLRLLRKEIRVPAVVIETPTVSVVSDVGGTNLARATEPRKKAPPKRDEPKKPVDRHGPEGWVFRLDRFEITHGDIWTAIASPDGDTPPTPRAHLADLAVFSSARAALGNGALDLALRASGRSERAPAGPLRLDAKLAAHGDVVRFETDGDLLGGTLTARGDVDTRRPDAADVLVALAIPRQELAGHVWGPIRIDARLEPGKALTLDALLRVPGVELAAKDRGSNQLGVDGRLIVSDLAITGRAAGALAGGDPPALAGRGDVTFAVEKAEGAGPAGLDARAKGGFESLRFGETTIAGLKIDGRSARLSSRPGSAKLDVQIARVGSGTTDVRGIALAATLRDQFVRATFAVASPARVDLDLTGRFSDDRHTFDLSRLAVAFPGGRWALEGVARLRTDADETSLSNFRLTSDGQALAVDAAQRGENLSAHLALTDLRLGRLPTALVDPKLRLDGVLNIDVRAGGQTSNPKVIARVDLKQAEYRALSKIDAKLNATLENQRLGATMAVDAPFLTVAGALDLPVDPTREPHAPIDVAVDVKRADLRALQHAAERPALAGGLLNLKLRAQGSAADPKLTLALDALDLRLKADAVGGDAGKPVDLGKAHVRVSYADKTARADVDFSSAHGGSLSLDATTRVDLSYPRAMRPIVVAKLPIRGKLVARSLDVAWAAHLNPRVESMRGKVTADAKLSGTVGDPQLIGDVRWKQGGVVATQPPAAGRKPPAASRPR
jgi:hypothetical protein